MVSKDTTARSNSTLASALPVRAQSCSSHWRDTNSAESLRPPQPIFPVRSLLVALCLRAAANECPAHGHHHCPPLSMSSSDILLSTLPLFVGTTGITVIVCDNGTTYACTIVDLTCTGHRSFPVFRQLFPLWLTSAPLA